MMAGNWKMYKTPAETKAFFEKFLPMVAASNHCDIAICPPFVNLAAALEAATNSNVGIGAQNLYWAKEGAFTGEISGPMLKSMGTTYVIVGHSERRQFFGETDETVLKRTIAALDAGLIPIVCVGELLAEREANQTAAVLGRQFRDGIAGLTAEQFSKIVIAYEPVWAMHRKSRHPRNGRRRSPHSARRNFGEIRSGCLAKNAHSLRRQRETRQYQGPDGSTGNRRRARGRSQPGPGFICLNCKFLGLILVL